MVFDIYLDMLCLHLYDNGYIYMKKSDLHAKEFLCVVELLRIHWYDQTMTAMFGCADLIRSWEGMDFSQLS